MIRRKKIGANSMVDWAASCKGPEESHDGSKEIDVIDVTPVTIQVKIDDEPWEPVKITVGGDNMFKKKKK